MSQKTNPLIGQGAPLVRPEDRRASVRYQSEVKGSCQTLSVRRETSWEAAIRDISPDGIGLLIARRFEPGALLTIELTDSREGYRRMLLCAHRARHGAARGRLVNWLHVDFSSNRR